MKAKKVLAVALSLAMLIGLFPVAGLLPVAAAEEVAEATGKAELSVYVSDTTTEGNTGASSDSPVSLEDALQQIADASAEEYGSGKIIVVGALTLAGGTTIDTGKSVTITSELEPAPIVTMTGAVIVKDNLTLDKMDIRLTARNDSLAGNSAQACFILDGVHFVTTSNFIAGWVEAYKSHAATWSPVIYLGNNTSSVGKNTVALYGGVLGELCFSNQDNTAVTFAQGADVLVDGATILDIWFDRQGSSVTYADDINIVLKSGTISTAGSNYGIITRGNGVKVTNDAVVNIIKYANFSYTKSEDILKLGTNDSQSLVNLVAVRRWINVAADGGTLTPDATDNTKYAVSGYKTADAVCDNPEVAVSSADGVLTLDQAGIYNVSWTKSTAAKDIYVDAAAGNDVLGSGFVDNPYKTLTMALDDADGRESANILLKGDFTLPAAIDADTRLTIGSADAVSTVTLEGKTTVSSRLILDNIKLVLKENDSTWNANYALLLDTPLFETTANFQSGVLTGETAPTSNYTSAPWLRLTGNSSASAKTVITLNGGVFRVMDIVNLTQSVIDGLDLTINGASVDSIVFDRLGNQKGTLHLTDNVNITLKNGTVNGSYGISTRGKATAIDIDEGVYVNVVKYDNFIYKGTGNHANDIGNVITPNGYTVDNLPDLLSLRSVRYWVNVPAGGNVVAGKDGMFTVESGRLRATNGDLTVTSDKGALRLPVTGVYTGEWVNEPEAKEIYVSQTGGFDGSSADKPTTWADAFAQLKGRVSGTIKLVASEGLTLPATIPATTDGELTITSADATPVDVLISGQVKVYNNLTLDNFKLHLAVVEAADTLYKYYFDLYGVTFKTTATFKSGYNGPSATAENKRGSIDIRLGDGATLEKSTLALYGGRFQTIDIGRNNSAGTTSNGADITVDGAIVYTIAFDRYNKGVTIAGDVNITLLSGSFPAAGTSYGIITRADATIANPVSVNPGVQINIIKHAAFTNSSGHSDIFGFNGSNYASLDALLAARRWVNVDEGGTLTPDGEGSFDAIADKNGYRAMLSNSEKALRYSSADKLSLPDVADVYTVEWRKIGGIRVVFVSDTAGTTADGAGWTADNPTTLDNALKLLNGQESAVIRLLSDVTLPATLGDATNGSITAGSITFTTAGSMSSPAVVTMGDSLQVYNDLVFDNVKLVNPASNTSNNLYAPSIELNGVRFETTKNFQSGFLATAQTDEAATTKGPYIFLRSQGAAAKKSTLLLQGGCFNQLYIGGHFADDNEIKGANITLDGANINYIYTHSRGGASGLRFTDDINLILKSGSVAQIQPVGKTKIYESGASWNIVKYFGMAFPNNNDFPNIVQDFDNAIKGSEGGCTYYFIKNLPKTVTDITFGEKPGEFAFGPSTLTLGTEDGAVKTYRGQLIFPTSGVYELAEVTGETVTPPTTEETVKTVYVNPNSTATTPDGSTEELAFTDVYTALNSLSMTALSSYDRVSIKLLGTTAEAPITIGSSQKLYKQDFTKPVTIEGPDAEHPAYVYVSGVVYLRYNITLDNMKVIIRSNGNGYQDRFEVFAASTLTIGENFQSGYYMTNGAVSASATNNGAPDLLAAWTNNGGQGSTITIKGGRFNELIVGGFNGTTSFTKDTKITIDGANVNISTLLFGNRTANTTAKFGTADAPVAVDVLLKRGTIGKICAAREAATVDGTPYANLTQWLGGSLVRVMQSDKFTLAKDAAPSKNIFNSASDKTPVMDTPFYKLVVPDELMDAIVAKTAADGAEFEFAVPNKTLLAPRTYTALSEAATTTDGATYDVGVLTLGETGVYEVSMYRDTSDTGEKDIYVDSELGNDLTGDGKEFTPYKTLAAAFKDATGRESATIYIRGAATLAENPPALAGGLTISGISSFVTEINPDTQKEVEKEYQVNIDLLANIDIKGDLTLDNLRLIQTDGRKEINIDGVNFTTTGTFRSGLESATDTTPGQSKAPRVFLSGLTKKSVLNLDGGTVFESLWFAPKTVTQNVQHPGADVNLSGGAFVNVCYFNFSNAAAYQLTYTDNINITLSDTARYTNMQTYSNCAAGRHMAKFAEDKSLVIFNLSRIELTDAQTTLAHTPGDDGNGNPRSCQDCKDSVFTPYFLHVPIDWSMRADYGVEQTGTAGQFAIRGDKLLMRDNGDGSVTVANKTVALEPGYHKYTFASFDELPNEASATKLLLGWKKDGGYVDVNNLPSGQFTLTPAYQEYASDKALFTAYGAALRESDQALRCIVKIDGDYYTMLENTYGTLKRGMLLITNAMLGEDDPETTDVIENELTLDGVYRYKDFYYKASVVNAKKLMLDLANRENAANNENYMYYNATLTGVKSQNYKLDYAYRGFVTYTDKNGVERTLYSDDVRSKSVWAMAQKDTADETMSGIINDAKDAGDPLYIYNEDGTQKFNPASLYMGKTSNAAEINAAANALREKVLNSTSVEAPAGRTTYYISGSEIAGPENSGTSPEAPLSSSNHDKIYEALETGNCNILFERGYVYRDVSLMIWGSNVFIGAYGADERKPILVGSDKNYAVDTVWEEFKPNIWKTDVTAIMGHEQAEGVLSEGTTQQQTALAGYKNLYIPDIGAIVFDHGKMVASAGKVVSNVREEIDEFTDEKVEQQLVNNYDFWCNVYPEQVDGEDKYYVYLYLNTGNPAELFTGIEMVPNKHVIYANNGNAENIDVDNLSIKYAGEAVATSAVDDVTITNCEIGYIGGTLMYSDGYQRHGNGITLYNEINGALVENNWVYQCYDDGYTNQAERGDQENILVKGNLFEYNLYHVTTWTGKEHSRPGADPVSDDTLRNITFEDNVMRFAGYGHGTFNRGRFGSSTVGATNISIGSEQSRLENVVVKNNYFDTSYRYLARSAFYPGADEYVFIGNTWNQQYYTRPNDSADVLGTTTVVARIQASEVFAEGIVYTCATENEMYTSVNQFDVAPAKIFYDGKELVENPSGK